MSLNPEVLQRILCGQLCASTQRIEFRVTVKHEKRKQFRVEYGWYLEGEDTPIKGEIEAVHMIGDGSTTTIRGVTNGAARPFLLTDFVRFE